MFIDYLGYSSFWLGGGILALGFASTLFSVSWSPCQGFQSYMYIRIQKNVWFLPFWGFSWILQSESKIWVVSIFSLMCRIHLTLPCLGGYPLKVRLICGQLHCHVHASILHAHGTHSAASLWQLQVKLDCASLSKLWVKLPLFDTTVS